MNTWPGNPSRRLAISMLPAAVLVATALATLRMPGDELLQDPAAILVRIVRPLLPEPVMAPPAPLPEVEPEQRVEPEVVVPPPADDARSEVLPEAAPMPQPDWLALRERAVRDTAESSRQAPAVNPGFEQRRESAALQFRPSEAPEKRYIWDNVEKDYLGRTILVAGECYRVLDDPSAVYRDIFETFTQYLVFCSGGTYVGRELPWVAEVRGRHAYLQRQLAARDSILTN